MASVRYYALRSLRSGVSSGTQVTYTLPARYAGMARERRIFSTQRRSLSGIRETYYESAENAYAIDTIPLTSTQREHVVQFLDSVEQGEQFEFAADGSTYVNAVLDAVGYNEPRDPALDSLMAYSFKIVQVP